MKHSGEESCEDCDERRDYCAGSSVVSDCWHFRVATVTAADAVELSVEVELKENKTTFRTDTIY